jgi:hypothetical protein
MLGWAVAHGCVLLLSHLVASLVHAVVDWAAWVGGRALANHGCVQGCCDQTGAGGV